MKSINPVSLSHYFSPTLPLTHLEPSDCVIHLVPSHLLTLSSSMNSSHCFSCLFREIDKSQDSPQLICSNYHFNSTQLFLSVSFPLILPFPSSFETTNAVSSVNPPFPVCTQPFPSFLLKHHLVPKPLHTSVHPQKPVYHRYI